jgi:hypothetical protein
MKKRIIVPNSTIAFENFKESICLITLYGPKRLWFRWFREGKLRDKIPISE